MNRLSQKIIVMGLGYIGLPTASMLATKGHHKGLTPEGMHIGGNFAKPAYKLSGSKFRGFLGGYGLLFGRVGHGGLY